MMPCEKEVGVESPFVCDAQPLGSGKPPVLTALLGLRGGYVQLSTPSLVTTFAQLPGEIWQAAQDWACRLEQLGAERVYWFILSEQVRHLHVHLYPRWPEAEDLNPEGLRGVALFEARNTRPQPEWTPELKEALADWANAHHVLILPS